MDILALILRELMQSVYFSGIKVGRRGVVEGHVFDQKGYENV
jgi:hypothetical protein